MMDFLKYDRLYMYQALQKAAGRCKQNKECNERYPDIMQAFYDTYEWLKSDPLTLKVNNNAFEFPAFTLNSHEFVNIVYLQLVQESSIIHLPAFIYRFAARDTAFIKRVIEYQYGNPSKKFNSGMSACVECFDHYFPGDQARQEKFGEGLHPSFSEVPWFTTECDYWLPEVTDSTLMKPFKSTIPTLVLYGEHDPFSTRVQAESHIPWFKNVQISETPGMAHGPPSKRETGCWKEIITGFFQDPFKKISESCYQSLPEINMSVDLPGWAEDKRIP